MKIVRCLTTGHKTAAQDVQLRVGVLADVVLRHVPSAVASVAWLGAFLISASAAEPRLKCTDVFVGGKGGYDTYRIPALVVTDQGTVLAFCEGRKKGSGDAGDIDLLMKRSLDGGRTWSKLAVVHEEGGDARITIGNPCVIVDRSVVHLLFTRNNKRLFHTRSLDDGLTWPTPTEHTDTLTTFDFSVVRLGTGPGHGIRTVSGRLVAPVWLSDGEVRDKKRTYRSGVLYSDDEGKTWLAGGVVPDKINGLNECTVLERGDGSLLLNMRAQGAGWRALSESKDGGRTWSAPVLDKHLPCPTCQASSLTTGHATDAGIGQRRAGLPADAVVKDVSGLSAQEAIFSNPAGSSRRNMTIRLSLDGARSWHCSRLLDKGPSGYSDLAAMKDGTLLCLYERGNKRYNEKIVIARFNRAWLLRSRICPRSNREQRR